MVSAPGFDSVARSPVRAGDESRGAGRDGVGEATAGLREESRGTAAGVAGCDATARAESGRACVVSPVSDRRAHAKVVTAIKIALRLIAPLPPRTSSARGAVSLQRTAEACQSNSVSLWNSPAVPEAGWSQSSPSYHSLHSAGLAGPGQQSGSNPPRGVPLPTRDRNPARLDCVRRRRMATGADCGARDATKGLVARRRAFPS
jgi:hypothetical protein